MKGPKLTQYPTARVQRELDSILPGAYAEYSKKLRKWVIKRWDRESNRDMDRPSILLIVQNRDGSYRPIDERDFFQLRKARWEALKRSNELLAEIEADEQKAEKDRNREWEDMASSVVSAHRRKWY